MKKLLLAVVWLFVAGILPAVSQTLVVRNFAPRPNDPTATLHGSEMKDNNGRPAALLRIFTPFPASSLGFDNPLYGVTGIVQHGPGEVWVYLPERTQRLTFIHPVYGSAVQQFQHDGGAYLKSGSSYQLELTAEGKGVALVASKAGAVITIDGVEQGKSPLNTYIPYGSHAVTARDGSLFYEGTLNISKEGASRFDLPMTDENLLFGEVTVVTPDGVEIWFRDKREGVGEFTTRLREGQYSIETRKRDHEPALSTFTVKAGEKQTFTPLLPTPHKGYLEIATEPENGVTVTHADTVFMRERSVQLPVGKYQLTFSRKGYIPRTKTFSVMRDKTTSDTVLLKRKQYVRKTGFEIGAGFVPLSSTGVSFHIGGTVANVELEAQYTFGLDRSKEVSWYSNDDNLLSYVADYRCDEVGATLGYRLRFAERFGLTPRVGYTLQMLSAPDGLPGDGYTLGSVSAGLKLLFKPWQYFGIYVVPSYSMPMGEKGNVKEVFELGGIDRGGLRVEAGLAFSF